MIKGADKEIFAKAGYKPLPGWSYRAFWWLTNNDHGAYTARGIYGRALYIDAKAEMVIARYASHLVGANAANDPISLPAYAAVADELMRSDARADNRDAK
jgi:CubicO group peptidase (beta-lactamase class C family)